MKRLYIAILLLIIAFSVGIFRFWSINSLVKSSVSKIEIIDKNVENNEIEKAIINCVELEKNYNNKHKKILHLFTNHSELESINVSINLMIACLKNNNIEEYNYYKIKTKMQFNSLKEDELLTIQNII